jgi:hypothetical protein
MAAVVTAAVTAADNGTHDEPDLDPTKKTRDIYTQLVISSALGITAFLAFCVCSYPSYETRRSLG